MESETAPTMEYLCTVLGVDDENMPPMAVNSLAVQAIREDVQNGKAPPTELARQEVKRTRHELRELRLATSSGSAISDLPLSKDQCLKNMNDLKKMMIDFHRYEMKSIESLRKTTSTMQKAISAMQKDMSKMRKDSSAVQKNVSELQNDISTLKTKVASMESESACVRDLLRRASMVGRR
jgi:chromosome segregation ATPase